MADGGGFPNVTTRNLQTDAALNKQPPYSNLEVIVSTKSKNSCISITIHFQSHKASYMARPKIPKIAKNQKIKKKGPFSLSAITPQYPYFAQLLSIAIGQIKELPDFSDDSKIAVMSDFSGEHKGASFSTYSFLILAYNKIGPFILQVEKLRKKHGLLSPYSEFVFKDLAFGPRSRALKEFLYLVDNFIHGAIITIAIDNQIDTVFGISKKESYPQIEEGLVSMGFGKWKGAVGEKVLRVCHSIAIFVALTTMENQRLLWYCDADAINESTKTRSFSDTQSIFLSALGMYCQHKFDIIGMCKSFNEKSHLDDLLSISDFAAGVVQDIMHANITGDDNIPGGDEKADLVKWIGTQGKFLSKITIQLKKLDSGEYGIGMFDIKAKPNI